MALRQGGGLGAGVGPDALRLRRGGASVAMDAASAAGKLPRKIDLRRSNRRIAPDPASGHSAAGERRHRRRVARRVVVFVFRRHPRPVDAAGTRMNLELFAIRAKRCGGDAFHGML